MDPNSEKKLSIDVGSSSLVSQKWGVLSMCHADANYDIVPTDVGKRFFRYSLECIHYKQVYRLCGRQVNKCI